MTIRTGTTRFHGSALLYKGGNRWEPIRLGTVVSATGTDGEPLGTDLGTVPGGVALGNRSTLSATPTLRPGISIVGRETPASRARAEAVGWLSFGGASTDARPERSPARGLLTACCSFAFSDRARLAASRRLPGGIRTPLHSSIFSAGSGLRAPGLPLGWPPADCASSCHSATPVAQRGRFAGEHDSLVASFPLRARRSPTGSQAVRGAGRPPR